MAEAPQPHELAPVFTAIGKIIAAVATFIVAVFGVWKWLVERSDQKKMAIQNQKIAARRWQMIQEAHAAQEARQRDHDPSMG